MGYLGTVFKRISGTLGRRRSDDPLSHPLGRADDSAIDAALATRGMTRADLFEPGDGVAPHRQRIAAMLAKRGLSPKYITARYWPELKLADHACAYCSGKRRCDKWLGGRRPNDAPHMFCPNAMTFERWRKGSLHRDAGGLGHDIDFILERGLERTRKLLKQIHAPRPSRSKQR